MTELSFLIDLLVNHKLPKVTKDAVVARIKFVEESVPTLRHVIGPQPLPAHVTAQSPSTQAAMLRQQDVAQITHSEPVAVIAQTPATAAAMASRQQAIAESMSGKVDKTTGRPRKF